MKRRLQRAGRVQKFPPLGVAALGAVLFVGGPLVWFASPWPTGAARYVWRHWHNPVLALALDRADAPLAMEIGNSYFGSTSSITSRAFDMALAGRAFTKALALDTSIPFGHYQLARIAFVTGDFTTALREIDAEIAAHPENLRSLYVRGIIYGYRNVPGDLALAESDFTRFTLWAPTEWAGYNDLSWIFAREGKYHEIETTIAAAFLHVPRGRENPWLWNMLGTARLNRGDKPGARRAFESALTLAEGLSLDDWRRAYSGDTPVNDHEGLEAFVAGISSNLARASTP